MTQARWVPHRATTSTDTDHEATYRIADYGHYPDCHLSTNTTDCQPSDPHRIYTNDN